MNSENNSMQKTKKKVKTKITNAEIVVHGTKDKPYFELVYTTMDGITHIGYSSYNLDNVFEWKESEFEVVSI